MTQQPDDINILEAIDGLKDGPTDVTDIPVASDSQASAPAQGITVMPQSVPQSPSNIFPVSANMPEAKMQEEISALRSALQIEQDASARLREELQEANARIAAMLIDRTQGVEDIIAAVRKFQTEGAKTGPVGVVADELKGIFKGTAELSKRAQEVDFFVKTENDLRRAMEVFKTVSGGKVLYELGTCTRPDFHLDDATWDAPATAGYAARGFVLDIKDDKNNVLERNVIIALNCKLYHTKDEVFLTQMNPFDAFVTATNKPTHGIFRYSKQNDLVSYTGPGTFDQLRRMAKIPNISGIVDTVASHILLKILGSPDYHKATNTLRAMGLVL